MITPQDVQAKLDLARVQIEAATSTHAQMVQKHGADWTKWPATSHWFKFESALAAAREEVDHLRTPVLQADFFFKEV